MRRLCRCLNSFRISWFAQHSAFVARDLYAKQDLGAFPGHLTLFVHVSSCRTSAVCLSLSPASSKYLDPPPNEAAPPNSAPSENGATRPMPISEKSTLQTTFCLSSPDLRPSMFLLEKPGRQGSSHSNYRACSHWPDSERERPSGRDQTLKCSQWGKERPARAIMHGRQTVSMNAALPKPGPAPQAKPPVCSRYQPP